MKKLILIFLSLLVLVLSILSLSARAGYVAPSNNFFTDTFEIKDSSDSTKKLNFGISNQTGDTFTINVNGTVSDTVTIPGGTLLTDDGVATFSNKIWDSHAASNNFVADGVSGGGAWVYFDTGVVGGSSVGSEAFHYLKFLNSDFNDQTHTFPDATGEVCQLPTVQTLTNKTIVAASNTITTAASGNLTSTSLNAALAELQTDIDTRAVVSDTAYNASTWDAVTTIPPSKNAVRDQIETMLTSISGKEPTITAGTTAQYLRGDKSLATFATDAKTAAVSDTAYNAGTWDAVVDVAPSKNAVRDQIETMLTSISGKEPTITAGTTAQYLRGDKSLATFATDAKTAAVSDTAYAGSWDGVTDVAPSKNAVYDQVQLKATIDSQAFTGTPSMPTGTTATTQSAGDSSTKLATTAFVTGAGNTITSSYNTLMQASASHIAGKVAGTYGLGVGDPAAVSGTGTLYPLQVIQIVGADYPTINGLAPKLRIRAQVFTNDVAPTGNYTFGLYPITRPGTSGAAGVAIYTIGTVVSGSNGATFTTPAADSLLSAVGSDFALPADGPYIIAVVTTGTVATSSLVHLNATLQMRNN